MATISMDAATLEIEPYGSLIYSTSKQFSFVVDQHTIGYLTSRFIVLHCIPLREERYLPIPAECTVLQCRSTVDGDYLALLERTPETVQISIYSVTQLKKISVVVLDKTQNTLQSSLELECPHDFDFAMQPKYITINYDTPSKTRTAVLAWQRAQIDDVFDISNEIASHALNKFSLKQVLAINQHHQPSFFRQTDVGLDQFFPSRQPCDISATTQNYTATPVKLLWCSTSICVIIMSMGEILVYSPPKLIGFVNIKRDKSQKAGLSLSDNIGFSNSNQIQIQGDVTSATNMNNLICLGTDRGEVLIIELNDYQNEINLLKQKKNSAKAQQSVSNSITTSQLNSHAKLPEHVNSDHQLQKLFTGTFNGRQFEDDDELLEMLDKDVCYSFNQNNLSVYNCKLVAKSFIIDQSKIDNISLNNTYCLIESNNQLYVWYLCGNSLEINKAANSLVYKKNYLMTDTRLRQTQDINTEAKDNQATKGKLTEFQFANDEVQNQYRQLLGIDVEKQIMNDLRTDLKEETNDVASMSMLLTLQNACVELQEDQFYDQQMQNELNTVLSSISGSESQTGKKVKQKEQDIKNKVIQLQNNPFPSYLNINTMTQIWNDYLQGYPAINLPIHALKQFGDSPRQSLQKQSLVPPGYRESKSILIKNVSSMAVSAHADVVIFASGTTIYASNIQQCSVFAQIDIKQEINQLVIAPSGIMFYAVYSEGLGVFLLNSNQIQQISFQVYQGINQISLSHGGGILAVVCDINVPSNIKLLNTVNQTIIMELKCHNAQLYYIEFLQGDTVVVTASVDGVFYGHSILNGERVFETILRNVRLTHSCLILGRQMEANLLKDEVEQAEEMKNQHYEFSQKKGEDFMICGVDDQYRFYEIANGRQLHQIQFEREKITCFIPVPQPPNTWNNQYIQAVNQVNVEANQKDRDTSNATTAQFGKQVGEYLDRAVYLNKQNEEQERLDKKQNQNQLYEEEDNYLRIAGEMNNQKAEQFSERYIKFFLVMSGEGNVTCYEWPVRDNAQVFKLKLHQKAIKQAYIYKGSILITISEEQILFSNLRFLLPAQAIFGANVRNKCLNKLKLLYDSPQSTLLVRLPVTRLKPAFNYEIISRNKISTQRLDTVLYKIINSMSEIWNYTDFRISMLKEATRQKKKRYQDIISSVLQQLNQITNKLGGETQIIDQQLKKYDGEFKKQHQESYKKIQHEYGSIINELKNEVKNVQQQTDQLVTSQKSQMQLLQLRRTKLLEQELNKRHVFSSEKELEIDRLDEQLSNYETALQEELKQINEECDEAIQKIQNTTQFTLDEQMKSAVAIKSWYALYERRLQTIIQQKSQITNEIENENKKLLKINSEIQLLQQQNQKQQDIIKQKDDLIINKELQLEQLKHGIHDLGKTQFVLSHKINELKAEIRPRDDLITDMRERQQELSLKLEDGQSLWSKISIITQQLKKDTELLNSQNNSLTLTYNQRKRQLDQIKKRFENFMTELNFNDYFKQIFGIHQENNELYQELLSITKKQENVLEINKEFTKELDEHKSYLLKKLGGLYDQIYTEDKKFSDIQMYSLDENSALLQESHRLKEENLALSAQLSKIMAMLQALKVIDLTQSLRQKGLYRAQSVMEKNKQQLQEKYQKQFSDVEGDTLNQSMMVKGLLNSIDASKKQSQNTQKSFGLSGSVK